MTGGVNLVWEAAHLRLYTLWTTGTPREQAFAVLHCTAGDVLIASNALILSLAVAGTGAWPAAGFFRVARLTLVIGLAYAGFSEWLNTAVRGAWTYSELMPVIRLAGLEIGVSPLAQWVVVPLLALAGARRNAAQERGSQEDGR